MSADWLPDGRHLLAAAASRSGEGYRLFVTGDDFAAPALLTPGDDDSNRSVAIHADGRALVTQMTADVNTLAIPMDGGPLRSMGSDFQAESYPSWMPDGEHFAQFVNRRGANQIWLMKKDGTPERMLVGDLEGGLGLAVSPDGRQIAFAAGGVLSVVPSTGGSTVRLEEGILPTWSPDSQSLVFQAPDLTVPALRKIRLGANSRSEAFASGVGQPAWSPDGKWIAGSSRNGVQLISADGKEKSVLSQMGIDYSGQAWSRDSRSLYVAERHNSSRIWKLTLDGKASVARELPDIRLGPVSTPASMSLSPDGKTLLASEGRTHTRVVLLDGLRPPRRSWERWMAGGGR